MNARHYLIGRGARRRGRCVGRGARSRPTRPRRGPGTLGVTTQKITVPLRFDHYYTYEQVGEALRALHAAYPELATVESVGKSEEGRDIWAMTVNNPKTGAAAGQAGRLRGRQHPRQRDPGGRGVPGAS